MGSSWQGEPATQSGIRSFIAAGLNTEAQSALLCMLGLLSRRTRCLWQLVDSSTADVLFLGAGVDAATEATLAARAQRVIRVAAFEREHPGAALRLEYPFRVFQVLTVLQEVDEQMSAPGASHRVASADPTAHSEWSLVHSLQTLAHRNSHGQWHVSRYPDGRELYVRDDLLETAAEASVRTDVARGQLPADPFQPSAPPAPDLLRAPAQHFIWHAGYHAGAGQLNPQLDPHGTYQLTAWPDFGVIRPDRQSLRMAALLGAGAYTRPQLASALGQAATLDCINRFFNATHASGLLHLAKAGGDAHHRPNPPATSFVGALVSRLRERLGLPSSRLSLGH